MKALSFKSLVLLLFISIIGCGDHFEDSLPQIDGEEFTIQKRTIYCTYDLTTQVNFLESRFGDCLSFTPPIPDDNIISVPCGETIFIQPFDCTRPLPVMEFSGDCEECQGPDIDDPTGPDPCDEFGEGVVVEHEKIREEGECCFIKLTVTNNSATPIGIYRNGVLLTTIQPGDSSWIAWAQGPDKCFLPPASFPTDVEGLYIAPVGEPFANCIDISFPECDEL